MAIKKTTSTVQGLQAVDAYHRVENLQLRGKAEILFIVRSYADVNKQSFQEQSFSCAYLLDGENPIKQAYRYLKTLPEFAGGMDC